MRTKATLLSLLLVSAAMAVMPASANWFSDTAIGHKNVGSAPNPTPDDLRAIGDSKYGDGKTYRFSKQDGHWHEIIGADTRGGDFESQDLSLNDSPDATGLSVAELRMLDGKPVYGAGGKKLGNILTVDESAQTVVLQTRGTPAIVVPAKMMTDKGTRVIAPTISSQDLTAMVRTNRTQQVAFD